MLPQEHREGTLLPVTAASGARGWAGLELQPLGTGSNGRRQESQRGAERRLCLALKTTNETSGREVFSKNLPFPGCGSVGRQGTRGR